MEADANAKAYDEVSGPQFEAGIQFIRELNLTMGDKVLDMGCGTGHLTKYIADIVGPDGQAVGVDPDAERIKIAEEKSEEVGNLQFCVGNSATGFPHDNEPYYDIHISTNAFHWVPDDEKRVYVQKAHRCLKAGGKLAIWCAAKMPNEEKLEGVYTLTREGYQAVFEEVRLFSNFVVETVMHPYRLESFEAFKRFFEATLHQELDLEKYEKFMKEIVTIEDDGQVTLKVPCIRITASKN